MVRLLKGRTSVRSISDSPYLELQFACSNNIAEYAKIQVLLDETMQPLPGAGESGISANFSSFSLSDSRPYAVYDRSKYVNKRLLEFSFRYALKGRIEPLRIHFKWLTQRKIPENVSIEVAITDVLGITRTEVLKGLNIQGTSLHVLLLGTDTDFYFGSDSNVISMEYWEFMRDVHQIHETSGVSLRSMTYPSEYPFWGDRNLSDKTLVSQIDPVIIRSTGQRPKRVLVDPFGLDLQYQEALKILREMEVHSKLEIQVSVIDPCKLESLGIDVGSAVCCFGDRMSTEFEGIGSDGSTAMVDVSLDGDVINWVGKKHNEVVLASEPWSTYKSKNRLYFDSEEDYFYIKDRVRRIKS